MIDPDIITQLTVLELSLNASIDSLIIKRDQAVDDKMVYRYIVKKLENALGEIHKAEQRISIENKI